MTMVGGRAENEKALGHALSRHIGYTAGAYDLDRIVSVLDCFDRAPSAYMTEVVARLKQYARGSESGTRGDEDYLREVVHFSVAMKLVDVVSSREARLQKLAPTDFGRALVGAKASGSKEFYRHFLTKLVVLADADSVVPLLLHVNETPDELHKSFSSFQRCLRHRRVSWLEKAFPEPTLLDRITFHISWLAKSRPRSRQSGYNIDLFSPHTVRHHVTPRRGWLQHLGIVAQSSGTLTTFGQYLHAALVPEGEFFWLGPEHDVQDALRIPRDRQAGGPFEDQLTFARFQLAPSKDDIRALVDDTARLMVHLYPKVKLIHAPQASLQLPVEFIRYRSYSDKRSYDVETVLQELFKSHRNTLQRLSPRKGKIGFYSARAA